MRRYLNEADGGESNLFQLNIFYGSTSNMDKGTEIYHVLEVDKMIDFHGYEMIWTRDNVEILFEDQSLYQYNANGSDNIFELFEKKYKLVINTEVEGSFFSRMAIPLTTQVKRK